MLQGLEPGSAKEAMRQPRQTGPRFENTDPCTEVARLENELICSAVSGASNEDHQRYLRAEGGKRREKALIRCDVSTALFIPSIPYPLPCGAVDGAVDDGRLKIHTSRFTHSVGAAGQLAQAQDMCHFVARG